MTDGDTNDYLRRLPIGKQLPLGELLEDPLFPFEGEIRLQPLSEPILPEPARSGEAETDCAACNGQGEPGFVIWEDERWRVLSAPKPHGLPMVAVLQPRAHVDLLDLPDELAAELGPMVRRLARAIAGIESVGRIHFARWGDGSYHFHVWFLARPKGMWQMRGAMLAIWDDLLPRVPQHEWDANRRRVAGAMAEGGGRGVLLEADSPGSSEPG
jgi:diadenosine tetraphosphate (Ap4A) HIT family hydrolase